jgi:hypothetical protein
VWVADDVDGLPDMVMELLVINREEEVVPVELIDALTS